MSREWSSRTHFTTVQPTGQRSFPAIPSSSETREQRASRSLDQAGYSQLAKDQLLSSLSQFLPTGRASAESTSDGTPPAPESCSPTTATPTSSTSPQPTGHGSRPRSTLRLPSSPGASGPGRGR